MVFIGRNEDFDAENWNFRRIRGRNKTQYSLNYQIFEK